MIDYSRHLAANPHRETDDPISEKSPYLLKLNTQFYMGCVKRIWFLSPMRAAKVQASLRIRAVSPEPPLLAHTSSESRGTFRQKTRSLAFLNDWACPVKICHDGMLEDTNSLDAPHMETDGKRMFTVRQMESRIEVRCMTENIIGNHDGKHYRKSWRKTL